MAGTMNRIASLAQLLAAALLALAAAPASAQALKLDSPLRIVVGYSPGGASDRAARLVADALKDEVGVPIVVENKTGAGGRLAAQQVKAAGAEQNVLMIGNPAINVVAPIVFKDAGYDQYRDFVPVAQVTRYDFALVVGPGLPAKDVRELIAWLKANPAQANFGVPATGSLPHFFALMLAADAGVLPQVVGYRGSAPLANDVMGGQIPVSIDTLDVVVPLHQTGKLRILAIGGSKRSPLVPDVPTLEESGIDLVADGWNALFAPSSMPAARVEALGAAVARVMASPAVRKRFDDAQMTPVVGGPAETAAMLDAYRKQWEPVVKDSGIKQ
jgi:tripartite-type tricarboxylate transporter receptor subunit TctC